MHVCPIDKVKRPLNIVMAATTYQLGMVIFYVDILHAYTERVS